MKQNTETIITKKERQSIIQEEKNKIDYKAQYLQRAEMIDRQCVYVSKSNHERISRFLAVAGKNKVSIGGYIDAIIEEHFRANQMIINKIYQDEISTLL